MARKCKFDRDKVLESAMGVFWEEGYCKTSMSKLVDATHLNPGSIYAAFKSKEGLFSSSLDRYGRRSLEQLQQCLDQAATPLQGIKAFLRQLVDEIVDDRKRCGCLLVNTALEMSPHSTPIRQQVNKQLEAIESLMLDALRSAQKSGELSRRHEPTVLAKYIMVNIWGLRVLGQTTKDKIIIQACLDMLLSLFSEDC